MNARALLLGTVLIGAAVAVTPASADTITFDGTGAPCYFANTTPLTTAYATQGVTFSGAGGVGGSILNQCGGFGIGARSGTDFLAFNVVTGFVAERFSFTPGAGTFELYVGSGLAGTYKATFFDGLGALITTQTITPTVGTYGRLFQTGNIGSVLLSSTASYFVADDLSFRQAVTPSVPEPATWALMLVGFGAVGYGMRRRQAVKVSYAA